MQTIDGYLLPDDIVVTRCVRCRRDDPPMPGVLLLPEVYKTVRQPGWPQIAKRLLNGSPVCPSCYRGEIPLYPDETSRVMADCEHLDLAATVNVKRQERPEGPEWLAELSMQCKLCSLKFTFLGVESLAVARTKVRLMCGPQEYEEYQE